MGNSNLARSQIALETTAGTPLTATVQLPGDLSMQYAPERTIREESRASMGGSNTYDDLSASSTGQYAGRCTTSTFPYWLSAGVRADSTISTPSGGTNSREHLYTQPLTTIPALQPLTVYYGDNTQALRVPGTFATRIVVEGSDTGPWRVTVDLLGRTPTTATFASLSTITNETAKNLLSKVYIDSSGAGMGGTQKTATFYGFTWTWESGINPDFTMDGSINMSDIQRDAPRVTLQLRAKWNSVAVAEHANWLALTRRFIRLENEGSTIEDSTIEGSIKHRIRIDGAYEHLRFNSMSDKRDGTTRTTWDLEGVEDGTWGKKTEIAVINTLAAL